jgi:hypothetical protein
MGIIGPSSICVRATPHSLMQLPAPSSSVMFILKLYFDIRLILFCYFILYNVPVFGLTSSQLRIETYTISILSLESSLFKLHACHLRGVIRTPFATWLAELNSLQAAASAFKRSFSSNARSVNSCMNCRSHLATLHTI